MCIHKGTQRRVLDRFCVPPWRLALGVLIAGAVTACAPKVPPPAPTPPAPTPVQRLASADALVRAGCLDCLIDAFNEYELLRAFPVDTDAATAGAVRAAGLIARRQRELGMVDDGYGQRARALMTTG